MSPAISTIVVLAIAAGAAAHPTRYPGLQAVNCSGPPAILSYHVHVLYDFFSKADTRDALALRGRARQALAPYLEEDCPGRYDYGRLCFIDDHDFNSTYKDDGPFPVGEWSIFLPVPHYGLVVPWFTQHRGPFSVLVHPNTACEYEDHSDFAVWAGQPWKLNLRVLRQGQQTSEFNQTRGNPGNPTCLAAGTVCGTAADGPLVACCGLPCVCPSQDSSGSCVCGASAVEGGVAEGGVAEESRQVLL